MERIAYLTCLLSRFPSLLRVQIETHLANYSTFRFRLAQVRNYSNCRCPIQRRFAQTQSRGSFSRERRADFIEDRPRRRFGIRSTRDRPANHQVIRPGTNRLGRRRESRLVVRLPSPLASRTSSDNRADARNNNQEILPAGTPNRPYFVRRGHYPVHARFLG